MVKLVGPTVSRDASGQLAGALIFSKSAKGSYMKAFAKPKQPRTDAQRATRAMTKFLSQIWSTLTDAQKDTWGPLADRARFAPYHAFLKQNQLRWRHFATPTQEWPATEISLPLRPGTWSYTVGHRGVTFKLRNPLGAALWGYVLYRQHDAIFVPSLITVKLLQARTPGGWSYITDAPVPPGTYRYMRTLFNIDGTSDLNTDFKIVTIP